MAISRSEQAQRLRRVSIGLFVLVGLYFLTSIVLAVISIPVPAWISALVIVGLGTAAFTARSRSAAENDTPPALGRRLRSD